MLASLKESDQEEPYPISFYKSAKDKNKNILSCMNHNDDESFLLPSFIDPNRLRRDREKMEKYGDEACPEIICPWCKIEITTSVEMQATGT